MCSMSLLPITVRTIGIERIHVSDRESCVQYVIFNAKDVSYKSFDGTLWITHETILVLEISFYGGKQNEIQNYHMSI
jgi:hypothetical protein